MGYINFGLTDTMIWFVVLLLLPLSTAAESALHDEANTLSVGLGDIIPLQQAVSFMATDKSG